MWVRLICGAILPSYAFKYKVAWAEVLSISKATTHPVQSWQLIFGKWNCQPEWFIGLQSTQWQAVLFFFSVQSIVCWVENLPDIHCVTGEQFHSVDLSTESTTARMFKDMMIVNLWEGRRCSDNCWGKGGVKIRWMDPWPVRAREFSGHTRCITCKE